MLKLFGSNEIEVMWAKVAPTSLVISIPVNEEPEPPDGVPQEYRPADHCRKLAPEQAVRPAPKYWDAEA